jgi:hypothetical protein
MEDLNEAKLDRERLRGELRQSRLNEEKLQGDLNQIRQDCENVRQELNQSRHDLRTDRSTMNGLWDAYANSDQTANRNLIIRLENNLNSEAAEMNRLVEDQNRSLRTITQQMCMFTRQLPSSYTTNQIIEEEKKIGAQNQVRQNQPRRQDSQDSDDGDEEKDQQSNQERRNYDTDEDDPSYSY